jgi:hypothetical protein
VRIVNRDGLEIASLQAWGELGGPAAEHHWKENRSAYELARAWIEGDAVEGVTKLLALRPELSGLQLQEGVAEKKTRFDEIPRGPRNHDLLVRATSDTGPVIIGVEGKADEPFDLPLPRWREEALKRSPDSGAPRRLDSLTTLFFGTTIDDDQERPRLADLGYQLFSGLAGTLADAKEADAKRAVFLVHEFVTSETEDDKHRSNASALDDFVARLGCDPGERVGEADAWISAFVSLTGDGTWMPETTEVAVAKLVTNRRNGENDL